MVKKAVDKRIPDLIRNGVQERKRSFFVVVGDRGKDVILNLHYILGSADPRVNKSVLWAYKHKLLGFTSHRKKRETKLKHEIRRGLRDANTEDPFELFLSLTNIRYVYYKETDKILGNTYGMCILQDFEALTPNLLARTIETVEGGGVVVLLLKTMESLKKVYTMTMDVHARYRTEAHGDVVARFNERFILSLADCAACLVVDDELNVLPISGGRAVTALPPAASTDSAQQTPQAAELAELKESLSDVQPAGALVEIAKTVDQAKAVMTFIDAIAEKTLRGTVALTAGRGRGKSAALGVAIAAAVAHGYSNIFITSPSPENLKTLFEFVFKGFDALGYADHMDYDIIQSTNPAFNKAVVRVNVHRQHRQTIQYIQPQDAHVLGQAELVVIDEAAAIPLPLVRKLMGPYLVFMASTINGYEGTGRSLSLKLIQQLREQSRGGGGGGGQEGGGKQSGGGRTLREATLSTPIRYAAGDPVEAWLSNLLCLDAAAPSTAPRPPPPTGTPDPAACGLFFVSRDTLFSYHPVSECFLQRMMSLYVASHYKNTPNDLQLMSDAPAHQLFVLLPPISENSRHLPDPLVVLQVALEGQISRESVQASLARGRREGGDLIPWLVSQQFQDEDFAGLSGARVVRIATNPEHTGMGYGARALALLTEFYEGKFRPLSEEEYVDDSLPRTSDEALESAAGVGGADLRTESIRVRDRDSLPPLLLRLSERRPDALDYIGVSYGLTDRLHKFWARKGGFVPVYLRQTATDLTGEHTCVMLRTLNHNGGDKNTPPPAWLAAYAKDFHRRFMNLLSYEFRTFPSVLALTIFESASTPSNLTPSKPVPLQKTDLDALLSPFDLKRLESYADNMLDYHVILDLLPLLSQLFFTGRLKQTVTLSSVQHAILLAVGLQRKSLVDVEKELNLPAPQVLAMFQKVVRKFAAGFRGVLARAVVETLPAREEGEGRVGMKPVRETLEQDLKDGAVDALGELRERERRRDVIDMLDLAEFELPPATNMDWTTAEKSITADTAGKVVSVRTVREKKRKVGEATTAEEVYKQEMGGGAGGGGGKKRKGGKGRK